MSHSEEFSTDPSDYSDTETSHASKPTIGLSNECMNSQSNDATYIKNKCKSISKQESMIEPISLQKAKDSKMEQESDSSTKSEHENDEELMVKRIELENSSLDFLLAKCLSLHQTLCWGLAGEWCRYCGARASVSFLSSPWGPKQLCTKHHTQWIQKELDLSVFDEPSDIESVINDSECTEKDYLISILMKYDPVSDGVKRRSLRIKTKNSNNKMIGDDDYDFSELSDIPPPSESISCDESEEWDCIQSESHDDDIDDDDDIDEITKKPQIKWKEYQCADCNREFISPTSFKFHCDEEHDNNRPFWCNQCPKTYRNAGGLHIHIRKIHEGEINHHCKYCNKAFFDKTEWKNHLKRHRKKIKQQEKPITFKCNQCDRVFKYRFYLKRHIINIHTENPQKPYQCQYCTYGAATKKQILWHENIHRNERQYKCKECHKSFNNKKDLRHHILNLHERPFKCKVCGRGFGTKRYLEMHHIHAHTEAKDKPYQCRFCDYGSGHKRTVDKHERRHTKIKELPFRCGQCGRRFELLNYLHSHITNIHGMKPENNDGMKPEIGDDKWVHLKHNKKRRHSADKKRRKHHKHRKKHKNRDKEHNEGRIPIVEDNKMMQIPMPKQPKDVHRPKKPLNAFFLFGKEMREAIKSQYPSAKLKQAEVAREIGKRWNTMNENDKKKYRDEETKLFTQFRIVLEEYQQSDQYRAYKQKLKEWAKQCNQRRLDNHNKVMINIHSNEEGSDSDIQSLY